jgi:hypothetical protein
VDVAFEPGDITPPAVVLTDPEPGATGVSANVVVRATFGESLDPSSVGTATFDLQGPGNVSVLATVHYDGASLVASLTPDQPLADSTTYTATLRGGAAEPRIKDVSGNALSGDVAWSFTTAGGSLVGAPPPAPAALRLAVHPNPSHGTLRLSVAAPGGDCDGVEVLDVSGRVVRRLGAPASSPGSWTVHWDGSDQSGSTVRAGLYFARLRSGSRSVIVRFAILP